ncbi:MAG: biopolymer transporter ExbD [Nitrospirota bacterium]
MRNSVRQRRRRRQGRDDHSLNITPFMNLMVVLIPFLLTGVVFSRLAVLDLNLPTASSAQAATPPAQEPFKLIVALHLDAISVRGSGLDVTRLALQNGKYDLAGLTTILQRVKAAHPQEKSVILLSEPDVAYESLVEVMDVCREAGASQELFPDISIGEVKRA